MNLLRYLKLYTFLLRLARCSSRPRPDASIIKRQGQIPSGTHYDIYQHHQKTRSVCIAVHGVTLNGGRDWRLINFARSLAKAGVVCIVPTLGNLASCRWETRDLDELANMVRVGVEEFQQPVGLIGFSFGGSYALIIAGWSRIAEQIRWVMTFSAYHDLKEVFEGYMQDAQNVPQSDDEWDAAIYRLLACLYGYRDIVSFSPEVWQGIEMLLRRYCYEASIKEKRDFYDHHLQHVNSAEVFARSFELDVLKKLSPAENMGRLCSPVTLIHDRNDSAVPPVHAERLFAELQSKYGAYHHRLVLTSLLSHVSPSKLPGLREIVQFANALAPLMG